jgi:hypothetical protein
MESMHRSGMLIYCKGKFQLHFRVAILSYVWFRNVFDTVCNKAPVRTYNVSKAMFQADFE